MKTAGKSQVAIRFGMEAPRGKSVLPLVKYVDEKKDHTLTKLSGSAHLLAILMYGTPRLPHNVHIIFVMYKGHFVMYKFNLLCAKCMSLCAKYILLCAKCVSLCAQYISLSGFIQTGQNKIP